MLLFLSSIVNWQLSISNFLPLSSRGLGHELFKLGTPVRIWLGALTKEEVRRKKEKEKAIADCEFTNADWEQFRIRKMRD
jgi:hypothetical protein